MSCDDGSGRPRQPVRGVHVVRTGVSELIPRSPQELIDAANITDPELLEVVERLQLSSVMTVPMIARGGRSGRSPWCGQNPGGIIPKTISASARIWRAVPPSPSITRGCIGNGTTSRARSRNACCRRRFPDPRGRRRGSLPSRGRHPPSGRRLLRPLRDGRRRQLEGRHRGRVRKGPRRRPLMGFVRFTTRAVSRQDTKPS